MKTLVLRAYFQSGNVETIQIRDRKGKTSIMRKAAEAFDEVIHNSNLLNDPIKEWIFEGDYSELFRDIINVYMLRTLSKRAPNVLEKLQKKGKINGENLWMEKKLDEKCPRN